LGFEVCRVCHHIGVIVGVFVLRKGTAWSDGFWEGVWHHGKRGWRGKRKIWYSRRV
jgi:hypothetical protein